MELSAKEIFSLTKLTLVDSEGIHYHYDPETQFYNQCHDEDGRFCEGPDGPGRARDKNRTPREGLRDTDGRVSGKAVASEKRGPYGGSLKDPHEDTNEFDGVKGYDKKTGKPVPGSDAWLEAHNITRDQFKGRPYVPYEPFKDDPAIQAAFDAGTPGRKQWERLAEQKGQEGGFIMYKHPIPDSPYGPIEPQVRPNVEAVTNHGKRAQKLYQLEQAKQRYVDLKTKIKPNDLVKEQEARVKKAEINLERVKKATPEIIRAEAKKNFEDADVAYKKAKESGDPEAITRARKQRNSAKIYMEKNAEYKASKFKPEAEIYHAQKQVESAKMRLAEIKEDPKGFLEAEIIRQGGVDGKGGKIKRAEKAYKKSAAKYLFTKDADTSRIDMNPDKQNVKNLTQGKGRIYFAMEGSIKNDAILNAIKREDPTAAVVNVPSVTLWHNKTSAEGEIKWFARTHAKNRQVILIPDADGVNNPNVERQANALAAALKTGGAKEVLVAAPPVKYGTKNVMDPVRLTSGAKDERKGIDDHLGAGRGTLGQLAYKTDAKISTSSFSLAHRTREGGETGDKKINRNGLKNAEAMLGAISGIAGNKGAAQISMPLLMQTSGITSKGSAVAARDKLADLGIIDIHYVFDKDVLAKSRKRVPIMKQKDVDMWVSRKIIKPPPDDLFAKDDYEASPIIEIKDPKYIVKSSQSRSGVLSDLPDWKPPKTFDGWRSSVTGQKDSTGQAERMVNEEFKRKAKSAPVKGQAKVSIAKTAKQRAATKKAPAGRRLVRTAEGAKRYGVKIGQPIPLIGDIAADTAAETAIQLLSSGLEVPAITSTVLLSSLMSEEQIAEFYNRCHDESGRFCEGPDGPGRVRDTKDNVSGNFGPSLRTVAKSRFGTTTVDGIRAKAVYELTARNGQTLKLYDQSGDAERYAEEMLWSHARMQEQYGLEPPRGIIVSKPGKFVDKDSFATVYGDSPYTYVNSDKLGIDIGKFSDGFQMPSAKTGNTKNMHYLMLHEYGHHYDFAKNSISGDNYRIHPLSTDSEFKKHMSRYGKSDNDGIEAYAETFAEWHHSGGTTRNPSARAMAEYEGWVGTSSFRRNSLSASIIRPVEYEGETVNLTLQNIVQLAKEDDLVELRKGIIVRDTFEESGSIIEGDFETVEPSEEEKARARAIMDQVLKELGMTRSEDDGGK